MRQCLRQVIAAGHQSIAIVCGAYHGPALDLSLFSEAADQSLLEGLPYAEVEAAWVPWSYSRLSTMLGYGAGVQSPGWYHHLWDMGQQQASATDISIAWLTRVAELFRKEGIDASSAHVIEAVRLSESLAAMRDLPFPGLLELTEASQTVLCFGDATPLSLIQKKLIVGERMGVVPSDAPMVPLQRDLYRLQRDLRLRPEAEKSTLNLDLRNDMHLQRSHLLHRLRLLKIPWGEVLPSRAKGGTYREVWNLQWLPEYAIRVIEANVWGNTVLDAASSYAKDAADKATNLSSLSQLLDQIILADLPETLSHLMKRIHEEAALSGDIPHMMEALIPLARVLRYGSVRQTDKDMVAQVVDGLITRISLGLVGVCSSLNDEAALDMYERLSNVNTVIATQHKVEQLTLWQETLATLCDKPAVHGLVAGRSCRLLLDARVFKVEDALKRLERTLFLSPIAGKSSEELLQTAFWIEGFLKGSGLLLLHDQVLWQLLDQWVREVKEEHFLDVLPLLRRTFANFSQSVRQQLRERIKDEVQPELVLGLDFDEDQARQVLPLLDVLLGVKHG
jgi:hypothetical protein